MIRSRLLQLLLQRKLVAGCTRTTAACTTCNKSGHNRTKQQQHLIASHVAPTETEREMPQGAEGGAKGNGDERGGQLTAFLCQLCICICICIWMCTYAKLYLTDLRDKPSRQPCGSGSICASSEISPAALLQVEQTILRLLLAKLAVS